MQAQKQSVPLISQLKSLMQDFNKLLNQHIDLFKQEAEQEAILGTKIIVSLVLGLVIAYTSIFFFGLFLLFAIAEITKLWIAALIVFGIHIVITITAFLMIKKYMAKIRKGKESVSLQIKKTLEVGKKWLTDLS